MFIRPTSTLLLSTSHHLLFPRQSEAERPSSLNASQVAPSLGGSVPVGSNPPAGVASGPGDVADALAIVKDINHVELPDDVTLDDYLEAMQLLCADELAGKKCRELLHCESSIKICQKFLTGVSLSLNDPLSALLINDYQDCPHTTFRHDDLRWVHIRPTCKSILTGKTCTRIVDPGFCRFGHDHQDLRQSIGASRRARGAARKSSEVIRSKRHQRALASTGELSTMDRKRKRDEN